LLWTLTVAYRRGLAARHRGECGEEEETMLINLLRLVFQFVLALFGGGAPK
jgi:hypothetical protein